MSYKIKEMLYEIYGLDFNWNELEWQITSDWCLQENNVQDLLHNEYEAMEPENTSNLKTKSKKKTRKKKYDSNAPSTLKKLKSKTGTW